MTIIRTDLKYIYLNLNFDLKYFSLRRLKEVIQTLLYAFQYSLEIPIVL
jgi:hypothetical protein